MIPITRFVHTFLEAADRTCSKKYVLYEYFEKFVEKLPYRGLFFKKLQA